jgi:demethylmenaquinone methyltransferase/2-methoxy-6-polyprenyl-1,4-benzoquinol methylase
MEKHTTKEEYIKAFFSDTGATYDTVVSLFTFGIDRLWKRKIVERLTTPKRILDLACGTGILTTMIAKKYPDSEIVAVDVSPSYLEVAWRKSFRKKIKNTSFILSLAEDFRSNNRFDAITASYLPKYAKLPTLIHHLSQMIHPGGVLLFHDFTYPKKKFLKLLFAGYFKIIPVIGGWLFSEWKGVLRELPCLIQETTWVTDLKTALAREGFDRIEVESLTMEGSAIVSARKK